MARRILVLAVAAVVMAIPLSAFAKGEQEAVKGQALIAGPGLSSPIELEGEAAGYQGELYGTVDETEFSRFLRGTPLVYSGPGLGWFELPPDDLTALGPRYALTYRFEYSPGAVTTARHGLYPYAEGGPMVHIPAEQGLHGRMTELWWRSASPVMLEVLLAQGLPSTAPKVPAPPAAEAPPPLLAPGTQVGIWVAVAGLLGLVLAGVVAGRRRHALTRA